jgi:hypothetical protein
MNKLLFILNLLTLTSGFAPQSAFSRSSSKLYMAEEVVKAAPLVSGEDLEMMMTEWDLPLVVDAYATW